MQSAHRWYLRLFGTAHRTASALPAGTFALRARLSRALRFALRAIGLAPLRDVDAARRKIATLQVRHGEKLDRARETARRQREAIDRLRTEIDQPRAQLASVLPNRAAAFRASEANEERAAEERLIELSADYRDARARWLRWDAPETARQVTISGLTFFVPQDGATERSLAERIARGWLPLADIARVRQLVVGHVMLDIGGNVGTTCIPRVALGDFEAAYVAEPDPANYECLVRNVLDNGLRGRVVPDRVAIANTSGAARFRQGHHMGGHRLVAPDVKPKLATESVSCFTLDDWVVRLGVPPHAVAFVKVDIQGWDGLVLEGAEDLLSRRTAVWQIEASPSLMRSAGYSIERLCAVVGAHFTHVAVMDSAASGAPFAPAALATVLAKLPKGRFANLLLYNGV